MDQDNNFTTENQQSSFVSRYKKLLLIILVVVAVALGIFIYLNVSGGKKLLKTTPSQGIETGEARLSFNPNTKYVKSGSKITADIIYDASAYPTKGVIVSLLYNPKEVTNVKLTQYKDPNSAISYSFDNQPNLTRNDIEHGYVSIRLQLTNGAVAQKGRGIIAKLEATVVKTPTTISFDSESSATSSEPNVDLNVGMVNLNIFPAK